VEEGKFTPKFKPNPSVPRAKQASILPSSSTSSKASNANQTTSQPLPAPIPALSAPVPVKKRTPIDTEGVGTIIIRDTSIEAVAGPAIPKDDTPSVKTTFVGVSADKGGLNVTTNYVKVLQVPDKLHVDSLTFWRKKRKSSISFRSRPADEAKRLEMATKEINDADSLKLTVGKNVWATDCKVLGVLLRFLHLRKIKRPGILLEHPAGSYWKEVRRSVCLSPFQRCPRQHLHPPCSRQHH
jgi:hypothetical protein